MENWAEIRRLHRSENILINRNERLFTERQRIGMAVRDGGCMADGCDRPPSSCEAHDVNQWVRDNG